MTDENRFRAVLFIVSIVQTAISVHYLRKAQIPAGLLRNRQAGIFLTGVSVVVVRTVLEDRFLKEHLKGYSEYTRKVKWRLVPGIW